MTAPTQIFEGFSLSDAQILDGTKTFEEAAFAAYEEELDIYGVDSGSLEPDTDDWSNEGDDRVMSVWQWLNWVDVAVRGGYLSLPFLASLTGRTVDTTGTGPNTTYGFDLWHEDDLNIPDKPMLLRMPSKDSRKAIRELVIGVYAVSFGPIGLEGPVYKEGVKVNYSGRGLPSLYDEKGVAFSDGKARVARVISIGAAAPSP